MQKRFTHIFLSQKEFTHTFFVAKTIYALRPESFCALKVAIWKVQTFWASVFHAANRQQLETGVAGHQWSQSKRLVAGSGLVITTASPFPRQ